MVARVALILCPLHHPRQFAAMESSTWVVGLIVMVVFIVFYRLFLRVDSGPTRITRPPVALPLGSTAAVCSIQGGRAYQEDRFIGEGQWQGNPRDGLFGTIARVWLSLAAAHTCRLGCSARESDAPPLTSLVAWAGWISRHVRCV